jgi:hypothetical protein
MRGFSSRSEGMRRLSSVGRISTRDPIGVRRSQMSVSPHGRIDPGGHAARSKIVGAPPPCTTAARSASQRLRAPKNGVGNRLN